MGKINKDTSLADILGDKKTEKILIKFKLPCLGCPFAQIEMEKLKIGDVCDMYGIDTSELIKELNQLYKE